MELFEGKLPPVEELLTKPPILRLLDLLATDILCLAAVHVGRVLHPAPFPEGRAGDYHERTLDIIHALEAAKCLRAASVRRLPQFDVNEKPSCHLDQEFIGGEAGPGEPAPRPRIFRHDGEPLFHPMRQRTSAWLPLASDLAPLSEFAKQRAGKPRKIQPTKFCYATIQTQDFIRSRRPELFNRWKAESRHRWEGPALQLIEEHRLVEAQAGVTEQELAGTKLTAMFHLNELFTSGWFDSRVFARRWRYGTYGRFRATDRDATIWIKGGRGVALYFLRPLAPDEILERVMRWREKDRHTLACLWL